MWSINLNILITGTSGLIGGRLKEFLKTKKFFVKEISRKDLNKTNLKDILKDVDIVINCIGVDINNSKNFKKTKKANFDIPMKLFEISNQVKVKYFFFISTFHVYEQIPFKNINEKSKLKITNNYNKSKILCEKNLKKKIKSTKLIIIRSCNLFGFPLNNSRNCWKLFINSLIKKLSKNQNFIIKSDTDQSRTYSSVRSFCVFLFALITKIKKINFKKKYFVVNYTSNYNLKISQVVNIVLKYFKNKQKKIKYRFPNFRKKSVIYNFKSLKQKNFKSLNDKYFYYEIKKIKKLAR